MRRPSCWRHLTALIADYREDSQSLHLICFHLSIYLSFLLDFKILGKSSTKFTKICPLNLHKKYQNLLKNAKNFFKNALNLTPPNQTFQIFFCPVIFFYLKVWPKPKPFWMNRQLFFTYLKSFLILINKRVKFLIVFFFSVMNYAIGMLKGLPGEIHLLPQVN
jgi:hypothetical protein